MYTPQAMNGSSTPLWEQIAIVILGPPIMACAWWALSRGWAKTVHGGVVSLKTQRPQKLEFWGLLLLMYFVTLGMTFYVWLKH
jgi:hypothetical protein